MGNLLSLHLASKHRDVSRQQVTHGAGKEKAIGAAIPLQKTWLDPNLARQGSGGGSSSEQISTYTSASREPDLLTEVPATAAAQLHSQFPHLFQEEGLEVTQNPHA